MTVLQAHTARKGSRLVNAVDAELVTIRIDRNGSGRPIGLAVTSMNHGDPTIHWTAPGARAKSLLAREVLWTTADLGKGERLHIEPKPGQHSFFEWDGFELDEHNFAVATGPVSMDPSHGPRQVWEYNIRLETHRLTRPLTLDPVIIIVEDP